VILIGIGGNLAHPPAATPEETVEAAVAALPAADIRVVVQSSWYASEPIPASDQPWFVNGVIAVTSALAPQGLLDRLLALESEFGRIRGAPNAARTLDLDLLDYDARLVDKTTLILPHPRLHLRRFVLEPLLEIAPGWRHPRLGLSAAELLDLLPPGQRAIRL
jgi:2-amino-4-hydroxy-6-hydroxymethyldihydropteridine diphosphokinase